MKRCVWLLSICMLCMLSGCIQMKETAGDAVKKFYENKDKPMAEALSLAQNKEVGYNLLSVPSEKYVEVLSYRLNGVEKAVLYQWIEDAEQQEVYSVLCYETLEENPAEIEFYGLKDLSAQCGLSNGAVVLSTKEDNCRLYVQKLGYTEKTEKEIENSFILNWVSNENHNLIYQGGFYEKEKTDHGWRVTYEVENLEWHGYVTILCDSVAKQMYELTYVEQNSFYDDARIKQTIASFGVPDKEVEQTVTELTVERRDLDTVSTYPAQYFEGSDYGLSRIHLARIRKPAVGNGELLYSCDGTEYTIPLNIIDTMPPEITYVKNISETTYFMPDAMMFVEDLAKCYFTAADESGEVDIKLADGRGVLVISENEFEPGALQHLELYIIDPAGNQVVVKIPVSMVAKERIPGWYDTFFDGTWDADAVEALDKLICNPECKPEEYLQHLYRENQLDELLTEEIMTEALRGMERMEELGITVTVTDNHADISNIVLFYANMANMPIELLQIYVKENAIFLGYGDAWPIKKFRSFVVSADMTDAIVTGMGFADTKGISISVDDTTILEAARFLFILPSCTEGELEFFETYKSAVSYRTGFDTVPNPAEFLCAVLEHPKVLEGYERLKNMGIEVTFSDLENSNNMFAWFMDAADFPEGLVQVYAEQEWDVIVPEGKLERYLENNDALFKPEVRTATENGLFLVTEAGLKVEYPNQLTFLELAEYFGDMSVVPAELIALCAKENMAWYIFSTELDKLVGVNKAQMNSALQVFDNLEKSGMKVECPERMTASFILACSKIAGYPDYYLQYCVQKGITLTRSDWKELENWEHYIYWNDDCDTGFQKAKELNIDFIVKKGTEIWRPSSCFENIASIPEEFLQLCQTLGTQFDVALPGDLLIWDKNFAKAMQGYQYLASRNITMKHSGSDVAEVHDFFCKVGEVPEELFDFLVETGLTLELDSILTTIADISSNKNLLTEAQTSMQKMENLKLDIEYDENVTLMEVIAFYRIMDDIPEEILKQYVSKGWDIEVECKDNWWYGANYQAQNSVTKELYDRALSGYKKVKKYGLTLKVTGDWEPIKLVSFYAGLDMVDEEILDLYEEQDWVIILSDIPYEELYKGGAAGLTSYGKKTIEITSVSGPDYLDDVTRHELGHYFDYAYGNGNSWCSDSKEFGNMFKKYKKEENGGTNARGLVYDLLHDLEEVVYREYAFTDVNEFFAESYEMYCAYPEQFKANYPDVYEYIDNLLD